MVMAPSSRLLQQNGSNFFIERGIRSTQEHKLTVLLNAFWAAVRQG